MGWARSVLENVVPDFGVHFVRFLVEARSEDQQQIHAKFTPFVTRRFGVFHWQASTQKSAAARLQGRCSDK
eukprot:6252247-Pyramimonas_sp.AAC.1